MISYDGADTAGSSTLFFKILYQARLVFADPVKVYGSGKLLFAFKMMVHAAGAGVGPIAYIRHARLAVSELGKTLQRCLYYFLSSFDGPGMGRMYSLHFIVVRSLPGNHRPDTE
jgi:hypothetical protein